MVLLILLGPPQVLRPLEPLELCFQLGIVRQVRCRKSGRRDGRPASCGRGGTVRPHKARLGTQEAPRACVQHVAVASPRSWQLGQHGGRETSTERGAAVALQPLELAVDVAPPRRSARLHVLTTAHMNARREQLAGGKLGNSCRVAAKQRVHCRHTRTNSPSNRREATVLPRPREATVSVDSSLLASCRQQGAN